MHTPSTQMPYVHVTRCWRNESSQNNYLSAASRISFAWTATRLCACSSSVENRLFRCSARSIRLVLIGRLPSHMHPHIQDPFIGWRTATSTTIQHFLFEDLSLRLLWFFKERTPHFTLVVSPEFADSFCLHCECVATRHCETVKACVRVNGIYLFSFKQSRMFVFNVVYILVVIETHRVMHAGCNFIVRTQYLNGRS